MTTQAPAKVVVIKELADPLREFRPLFLVLAIGAAVQVLRGWELFNSPTPHFTGYTSDGLIALVAGDAFGFAILVTLFGLCPRRAPNAIYLRAFRNDAQTSSLRDDLQAALGRRFRLSGIRDPRRRSSQWVRYFLTSLFAVRYSLPRFMNLEAGQDWKSRLWASLGEARCAMIDVSDPTPFVRDEVMLAVPRLGLRRVLFVSAGALTAEECRRVAAELLGAPDLPPERTRVAVWSKEAAGRAGFKSAVREFVAGLPDEPVDDDEPPPPEPVPPARTPLRAADVARIAFEVVPLLLIIAGSVHYALAYTNPDIAEFYTMAVRVILAAVLVILLVQMLHYVYACGTWRERVRFIVFVAAWLVAAYPLVRRFV